MPCAAIFCRVPWQGTRQSCHLCRVPVHVAHGKGGIVSRVRTGHTTKGLCLPCAKPLRHTANRLFHRVFASAHYLAVGPIMHTAKCLPCARDLAHGKLALCRPLFAVSYLPFAECKPDFAVCPWHTSNRHSPVAEPSANKSFRRPRPVLFQNRVQLRC